LDKTLNVMRIGIGISLVAVGSIAVLTGCAGPEDKFGRGLNNMTEIVRGGEMHRAMEQTALWDGPNSQRTTGFARGFTRTMARTGIGIYEVVTFPIPPYKPLLTPKYPLYPDPSVKTTRYPWGGLTLSEHPNFPAVYAPGIESGLMDTDTYLGFSGGEVAPSFPGSRFKLFDP
jgi:putative exosortase-associated protein (TIGR04073 family)